MLKRSTIQLLRFPFSLFLLPVFLWAVATQTDLHPGRTILILLILHGLVYPASNGYNSYMDRDTTPIGGIRDPLPPTLELYRVTLVMDAMAILLSLIISPIFAIGITVYILASHAYSYRGIRLKRHPVMGYVVVVLCQGALTYAMVYHGASRTLTTTIPLWPAFAASFLIGGFYPLTQVYQHEADRKDGVTTISYRLGIRGTFIFCAVMYTQAMAIMFLYFTKVDRLAQFMLLTILFLPVLVYFLNWARAVWKNPAAADFTHTMRMNTIAATCVSLAFLALSIWNRFL
jgi:1,4-dihydroxy-2-naphthoate octaprenyltransferase